MNKTKAKKPANMKLPSLMVLVEQRADRIVLHDACSVITLNEFETDENETSS